MGGFRKAPAHLRVLEKCVAASGGCVVWTGVKTRSGYGQLKVRGTRQYVHRVVFAAFKGAIPEGLELDHLCRVRACVNPRHLEAVSHAANVRRGSAGSNMRAKTHCPQGHPYDETNTYHSPSGKRACRTCQAAHKRSYKLRNVAVRYVGGVA